MRDYADENYLHARIHALRSRLLTLKDYSALSLTDEAGSGGDDPVKACEKMFSVQIRPLFPLARACRVYTPLFLAFLRQFELLNAVTLFAKAYGRPCLGQWYDLGSFAVLPSSLLREKKTPGELVLSLKDTYFAPCLDEAPDYASVQSRLELCASKLFFEAAEGLPSSRRADCLELMGKRIALVSAVLSLRLKKIYQWGDEKILPFVEKALASSSGSLRQEVRKAKGFVSDRLRQIRSASSAEPSVETCERQLEQAFFAWIASRFHRDYHSVYCVVCYLWLLYGQIKNLVKMIEGRRFGFTPERILSGLAGLAGSAP